MSEIEILKDPVPLNARKEKNMMDSDDVSDVQVLVFSFCSAEETYRMAYERFIH